MGNNLYPLVNDDGETFLTDIQLFRFVREKCGDAVADFLEGRILKADETLCGADLLNKMKIMVEGVQAHITELENEMDGVMGLIEQSLKGVVA